MESYYETGCWGLANCSFQWHELYIPRLSGASNGGRMEELASKGGVYHYQGSGLVSSPVCRNRSIIWRTDGHIIELLELSLDTNLVGNALRLHLPSVCIGPVTVFELASHVMILFTTCTSVHRLVLPHPETINNESRLLSVGKGLTPSIFSFVEDDHFKGSNMSSISVPVSSCTASCTMEGVALFVLGSTQSSSLTCIQLPVPGVSEVSHTFQLQQMNVIQKLWNIIPTGWNTVEQYPVGVETHLFGSEQIIISVFSDFTLKLWSAQERSCVMEHNLCQYFDPSVTSTNKVMLKKSVDSSSDQLRLLICASTNQIGIFDLSLIDTQLVLEHKTTYCWPQDSLLIDICLTNKMLWLVSVKREQSSVVYLQYEDYEDSDYNYCILIPLPSADIVLPSHKEPREGFLDIMFTPGYMTSQALHRTLKLYGVKNTCENQLRNDVISQVEREIYNSIGAHDQLSQEEFCELSFKCWNKFHTCSIQYEQLVRQPLGCGYDPHTGRVTLIQQETVSFLYQFNNCRIDSFDVFYLLECIKVIHKHVSANVFESFIHELRYHGNPCTMAEEISGVLLKEGLDSNAKFLSELLSLCDCINDIHGAINDLISLHEGLLQYREEEEGEEATDNILDVFSSKLSYQMITSSLREQCYWKLQSVIDILVLMYVLQYQVINKQGIERLVKLVHSYHLIYWLGTTLTINNSSNLIDLNELTVSCTVNIKDDSTLLELYLNTYCMEYLRYYRSLNDDKPVHMYWRDLFPWLLNKLLNKLCSCSVVLYECLLVNGQYTSVQSLDGYFGQLMNEEECSRQMLVGYSWIGSGQIDKGVQCFTAAVKGLQNEAYLRDFSDGGEEEVYWIKLMRCLERCSLYEGIIQLTTNATVHLPNCTSIIWSNLFKYSLLLKDYRRAYNAMMSNSHDQRKRECLRHLVTVLSESNEISLLCEFNYTGLEEEVEKVLDISASNSDPLESNAYDVLYCYHMAKDNFWKAAHRMYEQGLCVMEKRPCVQSLEKQGYCYVTTITLLSLVSDKYQWIVKQSLDAKNNCIIVTLRELKKEHQLIKCKLLLIEHQSSLSKQLCSNHVTAKEVCTLLNHYGYFDDSLILYNMYQLDCTPLYKELSVKCIELSTNLFTDNTEHTWDWLAYNDSYCSLGSLGSSVIDQAWNMLRHYLGKPPLHQASVCVATVTDKLLSLNYPLPQWLINTMKVTNISKLIHLYTSYNHLDTAVLIVMEYIDAVLGEQKEMFGLKNCLHVMSPNVWVPYNVIDQLMECCDNDSELKQQLENKLFDYKTTLSNLSQTQKLS